MEEDATQRGNTSTALAGSVAAAVREIMLRKLHAKWWEVSPHHLVKAKA
jgi:hypothetical protein